ncbi:MAG: helix-turn-helix domain-containing protein [Chloroflexi bacterium]|nr:helix-turn-helix domain-containing protein [Chloroflexota bacterium]
MHGFPDLLHTFRERAGLSQNALARAVDINPGTINRLETGERAPTGREQVLQLAAGIGLGPVDTNALVTAAGFAPQAYDAVGLDHPLLLAVAEFFGSAAIASSAKEAFERLTERALQAPLDPVLQIIADLRFDPQLTTEEQRDFALQVLLAARRWRKVDLL